MSLGIFISKLHNLGIYFRSLHFGNIVQTPEGELGLIDIADMSIFPQALGLGRRLRNFRHIHRERYSTRLLSAEAKEILIQSYANSMGISRENELIKKIREDIHAIGYLVE